MPDYLNVKDLESELIIGLVCAVGTETNQVIELLKERLGCAGYAVEVVKISKDVIQSLTSVDPPPENKYERLSALMTAGNEAREKANDDSVLALGAAMIIRSKRDRDEEDRPQALAKSAIIIDSLKRPEEVDVLRRIYPFGFVLLGVHAKEQRRIQHLTGDLGMSEQQAEKLIQRDSDESKVAHGQRLNKTFHLADFFVEVSANHDSLRCDIKRMVELWFGNPFITPTFDEHAMFMAFGAALRTADLSRQVGAVVARNSQILATGANECPKAGGGQYWPARRDDGSISDHPRGRDYMRDEGDSNRAEQNRIIKRIVEDGKSPDLDLDPEKLEKLLGRSGIRDLTEYGRVVHAEMEALLSCARCGVTTVGATLYCTTFPCHNCAKHIIVAGLERVVYVEPYPKSKALQFHDDSIVTGGDGETASGLVRFEPFVGIGPRRFFDLFSMHLGSSYPLDRKDNETGERKDWHIEQARLRIQMKPVSYVELEEQACDLYGKLTTWTTKDSKK